MHHAMEPHEAQKKGTASDLDHERFGLARAAAEFPELRVRGKRVTPALLNRWATRGVRGVVLESKMIGGRRYVWRAAVQAFLSALNALPHTKKQASTVAPWIQQGLADAGI